MQGPASSFNCPAVLILSFSPQEVNLQWLYPQLPGQWVGRPAFCLRSFSLRQEHGLESGDPGSNPCSVKFLQCDAECPLCQNQHTLQACREMQNRLMKTLETEYVSISKSSSYSLPHGRLINREKTLEQGIVTLLESWQFETMDWQNHLFQGRIKASFY